MAVGVEKVLKPSQCRGHMRSQLAAAFPAIVDGFVKQAKKGSCPHVKLASELLEKPLRPGRVSRRRGSAAGVVEELRRL